MERATRIELAPQGLEDLHATFTPRSHSSRRVWPPLVVLTLQQRTFVSRAVDGNRTHSDPHTKRGLLQEATAWWTCWESHPVALLARQRRILMHKPDGGVGGNRTLIV